MPNFKGCFHLYRDDIKNSNILLLFYNLTSEPDIDFLGTRKNSSL